MRLFEYSPAWVIEDGTLVGFDLAFTQGLALTGVDPIAQPDEALEGLSGQLSAMLCNVPDGTMLRFYSLEIASDDEPLTRYGEQFAPLTLGAYLAGKKIQQCEEVLSPRRRELYCFVSTEPDRGFDSYSPRTLGRNAARIRRRARELHRTKLGSVSRLRDGVARELLAVGVSSRGLDGDDEIFGTVWRMANPMTSLALEAPRYRPDYSMRSQLLASGAHNRVDQFRREGAFHRVVTVRLPPRHVQPLQILELCGALPFAHMLAVTLKRVSGSEARSRVEACRRQGHELNRLLARVRGEHRNAELPDHDILQQHAQSDDVLARLAAGENLYDVAVQVWFSADTVDAIGSRTDVLLSQVRACGGAEGAVEELHPHVAFLSMLPGHQALVGDRYFAMLATRAADMVPVFQPWRGAERPVAIVTTRRHELVGFDPFSKELQAWNATIAGGTGSGKSFTTRTLLSGWIARGGRVIVATRGGDYRRFADVLGGSVTDVSLTDPTLCLSPFATLEDLGEEGAAGATIEHLTSIVAVMVAEPGKPLTRRHRRLMHLATRCAYAERKSAGDAPEARPTFDDWIAALRGVAGAEAGDGAIAEGIVSQLRFWLDGPYGAALAREPCCGDRGARFSVWNLASIADTDTQSVVLALLSGTIARSITEAPTIVIMDEVWSILRSEAGADLVETLYRTVRKEGSAIWTISQSMNDYTGLAEGCRSAILNNSPIKLFLAHDPSEIELVASTFRLNAREADLLSSLRAVPGSYSEMLLFFGARRQVLRLYPTGIEYWLATSHPRDCEWEAVARRENPSASRLDILRRLARSYPHGALELGSPAT